jgi:hypothetical protein
MKTLIISLTIFFGLIHGAQASAPKILCSLLNVKRVKAIAVAHSTFDKNRHCTVSCMLTLKCGPTEAMSIGILKEIQDLFGPGQADIDDLKADALGVDIAFTRRARRDSQCLEQCDLYYP